MNSILIAFLTGLTTGGLSCLAVQGGLLASSVAHEVEQTVGAVPSTGLRTGPSTGLRGRPSTQPSVRRRVRAGRPIVLFLSAKLVVYTLLGFLLGLLGSVLQLTPIMRAVLQIAIGVFMVGNALRMFDVHPIFRYFALEPPSAVTRYIRRRAKGDQESAVTPLFLGALTVLIPCGVTQAMMAVAMGTGDPASGAAIMFAFILGTSPVFFAVAYLATQLGSRLEASFMRIVAVVVLALGLISVDAGLTLAGFPYSVTNLRMSAGESLAVVQPSQPQAVPAQPAARDPAAVQRPGASSGSSGIAAMVGPAITSSGILTITVKSDGYHPTLARAAANQPLRLAMVTNQTYSCARSLVVPSLKIEKVLPATGAFYIDIPPQAPGSKLFYSCSMGMYSGVIVFDG